jgi:hypothetical protein
MHAEVAIVPDFSPGSIAAWGDSDTDGSARLTLKKSSPTDQPQ